MRDLESTDAPVPGAAEVAATTIQLFLEVLTEKRTADSPGFPEALQAIPANTIVRDPDNGHAMLVTEQGWKSIPTG